MAHARPHPDRGDPEPWTLDPPRHDVRHRRAEPVPAEARIEVAIERYERVVRAHAEEDPEEQPRSRPDADREGPRGGCCHPLNGARTCVKSQVPWTMPEQEFEPVVPGQPPLSLWIAQNDSVLMPLVRAKSRTCCASPRLVDSVRRG